MDESVCLRWDEFPVNLGAFPKPFTQPKERKKKHRVGKAMVESSKLAYHELQTSDMKCDAHCAFIATTHIKRMRVAHLYTDYEVFLAMPERKKTKDEGGVDYLQ
jgi:hypothetical protein